MCVYGNFERRLLTGPGGFASDQVVVTGAPRMDLVPARQLGAHFRRVLTSRLRLVPGAPLVLFSSTGMSGVVAPRLVSMLTASSEPVSVIVKLHPISEDHPEAYESAAQAAGYPHLRVVREEFDLYDLLSAVDVHMSPNSTVLTEACVFDLPNLMMCPDVFVDTVGYVARGVAVIADTFPSLAAAVDAVLRGPVARELARGRTAFVADHFHGIDGGAARRVTDAVLAAGEHGRGE